MTLTATHWNMLRARWLSAFSPRESSKSVSSDAPQDTPRSPPVPRSVCERAENGGRPALISATARTSARKSRLAGSSARLGCVKHLQADVLLTERSGSPEDTDLERFSLGGPRIKHLRDLFVIESGARSRSRTLSALTACEYHGCLTQQRLWLPCLRRQQSASRAR
jgi:hypothetical protein